VLQEPPPREGENAATKSHTTSIATPTTPPAGNLVELAMYTPDPGIPHPPAAGAAAGEGGIPRTPAGELVDQETPRNLLLWYCSEREGTVKVPSECLKYSALKIIG
jgi:hypothetical protein